MSELERRLATLVGRNYCISTGSGTMAITLALRALDLPSGSEVVAPSLCCPAVPFAIAYAGLVPRFCDVSAADYNLSVDSVRCAVSPKTRAIVAVHLFGSPAPVDDLGYFAGASSLTMIEDAAQSLGGRYASRMLGQFGPLSVTSFGYGKILSVGGGGAVFVDDRALAREIVRLRESAEAHDRRLSGLARTLYNFVDPTIPGRDLGARRRALQVASRLFRMMSFDQIRPEWAAKILASLDDLNRIVERRNRDAELYRRLITTEAVIHPRTRAGGVCFRHSVLLRENADVLRVKNELKRQGLWASTLYPALHRLYGYPLSLQTSDYVEKRILNLPVGSQTTERDVHRVARVVAQAAER